jgi:hypothetical protein
MLSIGYSNAYATDITDNITVNTVWSIAGSPYVLMNDVSISSGVTLTIHAGVHVQIPGNNTDLLVSGTLISQGTSSSQVVFTGPTTSSYGGTIKFFAGSNGTLSYTDFTRLASGYSFYDAAVSIDGSAEITMDHCSFADNDVYGLTLAEYSIVTVTNCSFQTSGVHDVYTHPNAVGGFSNNTLNEINFHAATINNTCTWPVPGAGVRYTLNADISLAADDTLNIDPGVEVNMPHHTPDLLISGTLLSHGNTSNHVVFTGPEIADYGATIKFLSTGKGTLTYTDFTRLASGYSFYDAAVSIDGGAEVALDHCGFTDNEVHGLVLAEHAIATVTNCNFQTSGTHDVYTHPNAVGGFSNNNLNEINFPASAINNSCTWPVPGTGVRYTLNGDISLTANNVLSIDPGVMVYFPNHSFDFFVDGTLSSIGTTSDHIVFTGPETSSYGGTVKINPTGTGTLSYTDFTRLASGFSFYDAALHISSDSIAVSNCTFLDNEEAAIVVGTSDSILFSFCEIMDNNWGMYVTSGNPFIRNSNIYNNTYGINNVGPDTVDARANYWGAASGPYHLTLNPGGTGNEVSNKVLFDPWSNEIIEPTYPCDGVDLVFPSGIDIPSGNHRAQNTIQVAGNVHGAVIFNAGSEIELLADFEVFLGGELIMEIKDCITGN